MTVRCSLSLWTLLPARFRRSCVGAMGIAVCRGAQRSGSRFRFPLRDTRSGALARPPLIFVTTLHQFPVERMAAHGMVRTSKSRWPRRACQELPSGENARVQVGIEEGTERVPLVCTLPSIPQLPLRPFTPRQFPLQPYRFWEFVQGSCKSVAGPAGLCHECRGGGRERHRVSS